MDKEKIDAIPRRSASEIMSAKDSYLVLRIEEALNLEWWRGYHAAKAELGKETERLNH